MAIERKTFNIKEEKDRIELAKLLLCRRWEEIKVAEKEEDLDRFEDLGTEIGIAVLD